MATTYYNLIRRLPAFVQHNDLDEFIRSSLDVCATNIWLRAKSNGMREALVECATEEDAKRMGEKKDILYQNCYAIDVAVHPLTGEQLAPFERLRNPEAAIAASLKRSTPLLDDTGNGALKRARSDTEVLMDSVPTVLILQWLSKCMQVGEHPICEQVLIAYRQAHSAEPTDDNTSI